MIDLVMAMQKKVEELEERVLQLEEINASVLQEVLTHLKENQESKGKRLLREIEKDDNTKIH